MNDQLSINERIKKISEYSFEGNTSAMARATFIKQATLRDIISEKVKPSYDTIKLIIECSTLNISSDWLITGEGPMLKSETKAPQPQTSSKNVIKYSPSVSGSMGDIKLLDSSDESNMDINTTVQERIRAISNKIYKGDITAMARGTFISRITINGIIGDKEVSPDYDVIRRIAENSSINISLDWLVLGKGSMLKPESSSRPVQAPSSAVMIPFEEYKKSIAEKDEVIKDQAHKIGMLEHELQLFASKKQTALGKENASIAVGHQMDIPEAE